jgi:hypothetical protein
LVLEELLRPGGCGFAARQKGKRNQFSTKTWHSGRRRRRRRRREAKVE